MVTVLSWYPTLFFRGFFSVSSSSSEEGVEGKEKADTAQAIPNQKCKY
jgi:hypothetical protein